jgi:uncharacterized membrane protein
VLLVGAGGISTTQTAPAVSTTNVSKAESPVDDLAFETLDVPGARLTRPFGINASGRIVGLYMDTQGAGHGFVKDPEGTYASIDYPGASFTNAGAINARGDIVGRWTDGSGTNHGYLRTQSGDFASIDPPLPCVPTRRTTVVHGVNDIRDLVGRCFDASGKELGWLLRHDGAFQVLDDPTFATTDAWMVTNRGVVVGDYTDATNIVHGYIWTADAGLTTLDFPGNPTGVRSMNERGDITGGYGPSGGRTHGFLLRDGAFVTIDYPGSINNPPQGGTLVISNNGTIVGGYIDANGREHGFTAR